LFRQQTKFYQKEKKNTDDQQHFSVKKRRRKLYKFSFWKTFFACKKISSLIINNLKIFLENFTIC